MKKSVNNQIKGRLLIQFLDNKKTVRIEMDKEAAKFLVEELTEMINDQESFFVDYDPETGYSVGILTKNSLGLMLEMRKEN